MCQGKQGELGKDKLGWATPTGPEERGNGESVEGSGEGLINRVFSHSHQTQLEGACFPLLREELKSAQGGHALEWQFPNWHTPTPPHTEQDCARMRKETPA